MRIVAGRVASATAPVRDACEAVADAVGGARTVYPATGVGLLSTLAASSVALEPIVCVVADMDVTNLADLQALAGSPLGGAALLATLYEREGPEFITRLRGGIAAIYWRQNHTPSLPIQQASESNFHWVVLGIDCPGT